MHRTSPNKYICTSKAESTRTLATVAGWILARRAARTFSSRRYREASRRFSRPTPCFSPWFASAGRPSQIVRHVSRYPSVRLSSFRLSSFRDASPRLASPRLVSFHLASPRLTSTHPIPPPTASPHLAQTSQAKPSLASALLALLPLLALLALWCLTPSRLDGSRISILDHPVTPRIITCMYNVQCTVFWCGATC